MKSFFLSIVLLLVGVAGKSQIIVPSDYHLEKKEDFQRYEADVKSCITWLASTPRSEHRKTREMAEQFLVDWIKEVPYVQVVIEPYVMRLAKKNPDLLLSFMFGYTLYQLDHPANKILTSPNVAGLQNLLKDYTTNKGSFQKDEKLEDLIRIQQNADLAAWVEPQLKQPRLSN